MASRFRLAWRRTKPRVRAVGSHAAEARERPSRTGAGPADSNLVAELMRQLPIRGAAVLAAVGLAAAVLAGCTNSDSSRDSSASKPAPTSPVPTSPVPTSAGGESTPPSTGATATGATAVPSEVANDIDLRKNVQLTSCKRIAGGWGASGTAANPGTKPVDYTITIFFTTAKATVVSTGATHITVDPGDTQHWTVNKKFAANPKMLCVLRGVG
jgi:hypothetical protein